MWDNVLTINLNFPTNCYQDVGCLGKVQHLLHNDVPHDSVCLNVAVVHYGVERSEVERDSSKL